MGSCLRLWLLASWLSACSLANAIDVCERKGGLERDLNARTEGDQRFSSRNAIGTLPSGGAFAVWTSASPDGTTSEVRGGLVTAEGTLLPTCEADAEYTYSAPGQRADEVVFAAPRTTDQFGALAYRVRTERSSSLWLVPLTPSGCPVGTVAAVELRATADTSIYGPSVASLGDSTFAITWTELKSGSARAHLFAQRFRVKVSGVELLPTPLGPVTQVADAVERNGNHANGTLLPLVDGAALAFFEVDAPKVRVHLVRFDPELNVRFDARVAEVTVPNALVPTDVSIAVAFDADTFLVAWMAGDDEARPVLEARFLDGRGDFLTAPRAPEGQKFKLSAASVSSETEVTLTATGGGTFLAAWQEAGSLSHEDQSGRGLRAVAFDSNGEVRFANRACDTAEFPLNLAHAEDQTLPVLTRLVDGTVLAAWVTNGGDTADRSGTGLRVVGLTPSDLFPVR